MLGGVFGHLPEICQDTSGQQIGADKVRRTVAGALLDVYKRQLVASAEEKND